MIMQNHVVILKQKIIDVYADRFTKPFAEPRLHRAANDYFIKNTASGTFGNNYRKNQK